MKQLVLLICLTALACTRTQVQEQGVLDRDRFQDVLLEAQLIEARVNHELVVEQLGGIPTERYYTDMFTEKGTDKEQFERSFAYYAARPAELKAIYDDVFAELVRRKDGALQ